MDTRSNKLTIIIATNNPGKVKQFEHVLSVLDNVELITQKNAGFDIEVEETGSTFEENSLIKAETIANALKKHNTNHNIDNSNYIILSEDGGICIDHLNGEPGIYTARFGGENLNREEKLNLALEKLSGVPHEKRTAKFIAVVTAILSDGTVKQFTGVCDGYISDQIYNLNSGMSWAPIFLVKENNKMLSNLTDEELIAVNHRGNALRKFVNYLNNQ